ncbi:hypothetical protein AKJ16_DCAP18966 [Drosera capensis]
MRSWGTNIIPCSYLRAFCSAECREIQIAMDEDSEKKAGKIPEFIALHTGNRFRVNRIIRKFGRPFKSAFADGSPPQSNSALDRDTCVKNKRICFIVGTIIYQTSQLKKKNHMT